MKKKIHQIWIGDKGFPKDNFCHSWKNKNPEWDYKLWSSQDEVRSFVANNYPEFLDKFISFKYNIQMCDALRAMILYVEGGLYADCDQECISKIENFIGEKGFYAGIMKENKSRNMIENSLMYCEPGDPYLETYIRHIFEDNSHHTHTSKIREVLETTGAVKMRKLCELFEDREYVKVLPWTLPHKNSEGCLSLHHIAQSWR